MMISQTAEYALRAVVFIAEHAPKPQTVQTISAATQIPAQYLVKVMQPLTRKGIVASQRGVGGGYHLTISSEELTIFAIIDAVDPFQRITSCPLKLAAHRHELCALHRRLDEAMATIENIYRETTIAELLTKPIFLEIRTQ